MTRLQKQNAALEQRLEKAKQEKEPFARSYDGITHGSYPPGYEATMAPERQHAFKRYNQRFVALV